MGGRTIF